MSKNISQALKDHLGQEVTTLATCWKMTLKDGTVFAFTSHDKDISFQGRTYEASLGFDATTIASSNDLTVDELEAEALLDAAGITEADIAAGRFDDAEVEIFSVNYTDLSQGRILWRKGWIGQVTAQNGIATAEIRGLTQALKQQIGDTFSPSCRADLGDDQCKVKLDPSEWSANTTYAVRPDGDAGDGDVVKPTTPNGFHYKCITAGTSGGSEPSWPTSVGDTVSDGGVSWEAILALTVQGTVTAQSGDQQTFTDSNLGQTDGFFAEGKITWQSGENEGLAMEAKTFSNGQISLYEPMPYPIQVGDTFKVTAGCRKRFREDCINKFNNVVNFRGEPYLPGPGEVRKIGGATA